MAPPVNITQIAEAANVSRATVSLALRDGTRIAELVRWRIRTIAEQLGYRRNPLVSAHMAYVRATRKRPQAQRIALVSHLAEEEMNTPSSPLPHRTFVHAARQRAHALGYEVEVHRLENPTGDGAALARVLRRRKIGGIVFLPFSVRGGARGLDLDLAPFASVMIEHAFIEPRLHKVCVDQLATIGRLLQRMLDYGYERIGIALPEHMDAHANHSWLAGYGIFHALCAEEQRVPHFISKRWTRDAVLAWYRRWRPHAIVTIDSDVVVWLREAGIDVPGEVACATLSWTARCPELSGYYHNCELVGSLAVDQIATQLFRNERGLPEEQRTLLVDACWREGATLPRRTAPGTQSALRIWTR